MNKKIIIPVLMCFSLSLTGCKNKYYEGVGEYYKEFINIQYGDDNNRQLADLYIPNDVKKPNGVIYCIHGGAWQAGSKDNYRDFALRYVQHGYITAAISYRYSSKEYHGEDILNDITTSMTFVKKKAKENGYDLQHALLTGSSAGAHLSLLYGYSKKDIAPITPTCILSYCGPTNLLDNEYYTNATKEQIYKLFGNLTGYYYSQETLENEIPYLKQMSPITYVNANSIPTIICHGEQDDTVPYQNAIDLNNKLNEFGVEHRFISFPNSGHELGHDPECFDLSEQYLYEYADTYL